MGKPLSTDVHHCDMDSAIENDSASEKNHSNTVVTHYRWVIVSLYTLVYFGNCAAGVVFAIADLSCKFYGVSDYAITWSSNAAFITQLFGYIVGTMVASWLGVRTTVVLSSGLNAISACLMFAAAQPDGFPFFVVGYVFQTMSNCLVASLAPEISAIWFEKDRQVLATNFGLSVGYCIGNSAGFLIPAILFKNSKRNKSMRYVGDSLFWTMAGQVIFTGLLFVLVLVGFKERPKVPPTIAEARRCEIVRKSNVFVIKVLFSDISRIAMNFNFQLAAISLALIEYTDFIIATQLNQILSWKYKDSEAIVGWVGFATFWIALAGAFLLGLVVDRTKKWKLCAMIFSVLSALFWVAFMECLRGYVNMTVTFSMSFLHSFFSAPLVPILTDAVVEMTYPISPSHSYVYVLTIEQIYAIIIVFVSGWLFHLHMQHIYLLITCLAFVTAAIFIGLCRIEPRRSLCAISPAGAHTQSPK